jgi:hypothetical protein
MTAPPVIQFEFRRAELTNFARYRDIMQACFGRRPDDEYFRWKYLQNPAGPLVAFEAVYEGEIAAFYGVIPWCFTVRGQHVPFYQSMDTMTHPRYSDEVSSSNWRS